MHGNFKDVFEIATKISTPLMLSGIVVFVLFFVIYRIVSRLPVPEVKSTDTTKVLVQIIRAVWILALVAVVLGVAGYVVQITLNKKYPQLSPNYVDVGTDTEYPLEAIVKLVAIRRNVTIYFHDGCDSTIEKAKISAGDHDGVDVEDFLNKLKDRINGKSINYTVKKEGDARYEIICL